MALLNVKHHGLFFQGVNDVLQLYRTEIIYYVLSDKHSLKIISRL